MHYQYIPYLWLSALSTVISIVLILFAWRNRKVRGAVFFLLTMILVVIWIVTQGLEFAAIDLTRKIIWANIQYLAIMFAPVSYLAMVLLFTGRENWLTKRWFLALLLIMPIILNVLIWTNDLHHLIRQNVFLDNSGSFPLIGKTFGPLLWVFATYNFSVNLLSLALLANTIKQKAALFREQVALLFIGLLLPVITTATHLSGLLPFYFDLTPPVFSLAGAFIFWGIFRYRLFSLVPIARSTVIEGMHTGVIVLDQEGRIVDINPAVSSLLNVQDTSRMVGQKAETFFINYPGLLNVYHAGENTSGELNIEVNGQTRYYEVIFSCLMDNRGKSLGQLILIHEITVRKQAEAALRKSITERLAIEKALEDEKELFKTTLLSIGDAVISTDKQGNIELMNKVAEQLCGWKQAAAVGKPLEEIFKTINRFSHEKCNNPVKMVLNRGQAVEPDDNSILISREGKQKLIEEIAAPIRDENGLINGVVLVFRDFTEKHERQEEIEYLSFYDQLTGLYNRRFYETELKRLDTERNLPLSLIMGDVNGLKLANDAFGHSLGDRLLQKAAQIMSSQCQADDIIARIGGDEFVILLPNTNSIEAEKTVKHMNEILANTKVDSINLSVSFGWETKLNANQEMDEVFKKAENHMYRRKLSEGLSMRNQTIQMFVQTLYEKNEREKLHSERVSYLCKTVGEALCLSRDDIKELQTVGLMHDIGKIAIDSQILNKPDLLNASEWLEIKRHVETGYRILSSVNEFSQLAEYVLFHHESWDGTGYPKGLKGKEIPMASRIIAVADAYDAMTSDRPYRKALCQEAAIAEIMQKSGSHFDPAIARILVETVSNQDAERNTGTLISS